MYSGGVNDIKENRLRQTGTRNVNLNVTHCDHTLYIIEYADDKCTTFNEKKIKMQTFFVWSRIFGPEI